jgi:hypothetical protein
MTYTQEEKKEFYKKIREEHAEAKKLSAADEETRKRFEAANVQISFLSFWIIQKQMSEQGLDGFPYLDAKTFGKWREEGLTVKKGAKSTLKSVAWIHPKGKDGKQDEEKLFPKVYHLFHRSQVETK